MKNKKKNYLIIIYIVGALIGIVGALYGYFIYVPKPDLPILTSSSLTNDIGIGKQQRSFIEYTPKKIQADPALLIVLHGTNIDGKTIEEWTGYKFDRLADRYGFTVAYPDGYGKDWNDCRKGDFSKTKKEHIDDVAFIKLIIKYYQSKYGVDPKKVFLFGYSSGGTMAYKLAMEKLKIAGIATISAALPTKETNNGRINSPMPPLMMVNGTDDGICPFKGGPLKLFGQRLGTVISARATAEAFAVSNSITGTPKTTKLPHADPDDPTNVVEYNWYKAGQSIVRLYEVQGGGHVVPQSLASFPRIMGKMTKDLDAPEEAVSFFGLRL
jgi:polyhydroxybutyrate depolymerase